MVVKGIFRGCFYFGNKYSVIFGVFLGDDDLVFDGEVE